MRHADHRRVVHGGVLEERGLDLDAVHVLAAADHHVLGAVDDVDEALVVEPGDVAALEPAVGERGLGRLGLVQVALHDVRAPGSRARRPRRPAASLPSSSTTFTSHTGTGTPDAVGLALVVDAGVQRRDRRRLGEAVAVARRAPGEHCLDPAHELGRGRRAAVADRRDARDVARREVDGDASTCHTIAGTPPNVVMRSRSISSSARSASHLCMITIFPPDARLATSTEWQPVAWKNGTREQVRVLVAGVAGAASGPRRAPGPRHAPAEREADQVRADVAVRAERALRPAGRARRVEDRGVVLGLERRRRAARRRRARRRARPRTVDAPVGARRRPRRATIDRDARARAATPCAGARSARRRRTRPPSPSRAARTRARRPVHHALSGTTTAPAAVAAQNAIDHSGKLRIAIATRSPFSHAEAVDEDRWRGARPRGSAPRR